MVAHSLIVVMCTLFLLSVPIAVAIGLAAIFGIQVMGAVKPTIIGQQLYVSLNKFPLVAIPFFILAGNLMITGGISRRLVDFARVLVGNTQGGLAATCVVTSMFFAAVSGSSTATTFAIGAIMIPALVKAGYPRPWTASLQATSAELGVVIPPSIPLILYGVAADVSIGELFIAGFGPGLLIAAALIAYVLVWARLTGNGKADAVTGLKPWPAFRSAFWALLMPVVVLGGIHGGVFTPTEASAVAIAYAFVIGMFVYRELRDMWVEIDKRFSELTGAPIGETYDKYVGGIALGRAQTPDDVAALVSYLAGPDSDYITGQAIITDGGIVYR